WNTVDFKDDPLVRGLSPEDSFYFVHSYYISPASEDLVLGTSEYGIPFTAAVRKDNVWATQFHPEKSGKAGLKILENFINL
ncbi:MAG: imidazole glycerol phosphate synthase subunit HisH, partial [Spirochaetales bacterium]|nr:imidazole glycerol phosphate synthase subunit HisH [Spirochaetales bacterium]